MVGHTSILSRARSAAASTAHTRVAALAIMLGLLGWVGAARGQVPIADPGPLPPSATNAKVDTDEPANAVAITIYNQDFAVVRERRRLPLTAGRSTMRFTDVAATIVPESVQFRALDPVGAATVVEQNYEYDLVSADKLFDKYIDRSVRIVTRDGGLLEGTLMNADPSQVVLSGRDGIALVPRGENVKDVQFAALPEGLLTRPTLVWLLDSKRAGDTLVEVAYRADQVNWRVDYRAVADADGKAVDLSGWVTVNNRSGRTYADARLKLMAGDVHVVEERPSPTGMPRMLEGRAVSAKGGGFEEKSFAEYHLYELPRPATIADRQIKQIELIDVEHVPVTHTYQYRGESNNVAVMLEFKNARATREGLGIPLPKGTVRVYQRDTDGQVEFLGADEIDHTPKDEPVKVRIGNAFDVVGERTQTAQRNPASRVAEMEWRIRLRNHKDQAVTIEALEPMTYQRSWDILASSQGYEKKDSRTISFKVNVPANGESVITYTVRYWW